MGHRWAIDRIARASTDVRSSTRQPPSAKPASTRAASLPIAMRQPASSAAGEKSVRQPVVHGDEIG